MSIDTYFRAVIKICQGFKYNIIHIMETQANQFIFREPKKVELKSVEFSSFSHRQLVAIIKSASYLIAADNRFTNEEKSWLWLLCSNANVSNPQQAFEESHGMDVNEMFTSIYSMSKGQKETVFELNSRERKVFNVRVYGSGDISFKFIFAD